MRTASMAIWLMNRFGIAESVIGDIVEQFPAGRSQLWFWRQTCGAIVLAILDDVAKSPFFVIRAVLSGLLLLAACQGFFRWTQPSLDMWISGLILDQVSLSRPVLLLVVGFVNALVAVPAWLMVGWLVARSHRRRVVVLLVAVVWTIVAPHYVRQVWHSLVDPTFVRYRDVNLAIIAVSIGAFALSAVAGGLSVKERCRRVA
jgi:hypothetical protein